MAFRGANDRGYGPFFFENQWLWLPRSQFVSVVPDTFNHGVVGSSPTALTKQIRGFWHFRAPVSFQK